MKTSIWTLGRITPTEARLQVESWLQQYPEDIFTPVTPEETRPLGGLSDRIAAHAVRHVLRGILGDLERMEVANV